MKNKENIVRLPVKGAEVTSPFVALCQTPAQAERRERRRKKDRNRRAVRLLMLECVVLAAALVGWTWVVLRIP